MKGIIKFFNHEDFDYVFILLPQWQNDEFISVQVLFPVRNQIKEHRYLIWSSWCIAIIKANSKCYKTKFHNQTSIKK